MIEIRDARPEDVRLLAWTVIVALGLDENLAPQMEPVCAREDTLYSWKRARVAEVDGKAAGCLIAYSGDEYLALRPATWNSFSPFVGDDQADFEPETFPGEFYLDSLAVLPEFRGCNLGRLLLLDGDAKGRSLGFTRVTLIAESDHPRLLDYYGSIGFREFGEMLFFGNWYKRMEKTV